MTAYGRRDATRTAHFQEAQAHLGFRRATEEDLQDLTAWLLERALEHDKPTVLFQLACERLHRDKIVRPGVTRLEKIVAAARAQAGQATFDRLQPLLIEERRRQLDQLLVVNAATSHTPLTWLRQTATANSAPAILAALAKLDYVHAHEVATWDLGVNYPNRLKFLAQVARKSTPQMLQRASAERRYPALVANGSPSSSRSATRSSGRPVTRTSTSWPSATATFASSRRPSWRPSPSSPTRRMTRSWELSLSSRN